MPTFAAAMTVVKVNINVLLRQFGRPIMRATNLMGQSAMGINSR